jgi:hypothetical protein
MFDSPEKQDSETSCYFGERRAPGSALLLVRIAQRIPDQQTHPALTVDQECDEHLR